MGTRGGDPAHILLDKIARLTEAEVMRLAASARRHVQDPQIKRARAEATDAVEQMGNSAELVELAAVLRQWAATPRMVGDVTIDGALPPRVAAYPVLFDALLAEVAGDEATEETRATLLASWVGAGRAT